jgi:transposase
MTATARLTAHEIEVSVDEIEAILEKASHGPLSEEERELLRDLTLSYCTLLGELGDKKATIKRLRHLVFGTKTETKKNVLGRGQGRQAADAEAGAESKPKPKSKKKGHGRIPAKDYTGAEKVKVPHESLSAGGSCPHCEEGRIYGKEPRRLVRIRGCAPLAATVYEQQRFRCNLCGEVFNAKPPPEVGDEKFDETAVSMVGLLRYGNGFPMNRIAVLQEAMGVPLPVSTQWELVRDAAGKLEPALEELIRQAAQAGVFYNDDTSMRILDFLAEKKKREESGEKPLERTGTFTSGIVAELQEGQRIVLYFTGQRHAGENLERVLANRASGLAPPVQMCDGLDRNVPGEMKTILSNCLAHARRQHVDVMESFPEQVEHMIEQIALVYEHDARAKSQGMSAEERLRLHQEESGPVMDRLETWMEALLAEKKVEPNSGLGKAIAYCLKRWKKLTLFLREPGAPLDNNITERMLKRAILHRKGSLFYKTANGARVGDLYMSLIATAKLAKADPFDYLNELQRRAKEVATNPSEWMPWNYRETLARTATAS